MLDIQSSHTVGDLTRDQRISFKVGCMARSRLKEHVRFIAVQEIGKLSIKGN